MQELTEQPITPPDAGLGWTASQEDVLKDPSSGPPSDAVAVGSADTEGTELEVSAVTAAQRFYRRLLSNADGSASVAYRAHQACVLA
eukprot:SAG31_NODE_33764_length_340_cov_0.850622_1_plen_86_part_01